MWFIRLVLITTLCSLSGWSSAQVAPVGSDSAAVAPPQVEPEKAKRPGRLVRLFAPSDKPNFVPIPSVFSQQETGLAVALSSLPVWRFGSDTTTRKSNVRLGAWISQKGQTSVQLTHNIFTPGEKLYLLGEVSYYDVNYFYYGIGNETRKADESQVDYTVFIFNQRALWKVKHNVFAGLQYRFTHLRDILYEEPSEQGGQNKFQTDLQQGNLTTREAGGGNTSGFGPAVLYDGRDNVLATYHGQYLHVHGLFAGRYAGSDYSFNRFQVDARHFQPLIKSTNTILALQYLGQFHTGGRVPFRELSAMGADLGGSIYNYATLMRGIYEGRFRDRQMMTFQAEIRQKLFWRFDGAVFGSVGEVANQLRDFSVRGTKFAGGVGGRFRLNQRDRLNVRLDYGVGSGGSSGIYFSIGEAF
ncbi:outer membrane protein assembly factor [Hymenobacter sp. BT635]|uniref:Outer membrane protein assembly factor n=1 Tax=Hymenobacter nitidus TaxID=2880929 RepID=A0ABS8ADK4_9BACT|nr:BamA/TamA family outer membrane protein [Hymenobacter nitidus]MCB2377300.1 outer membrane protein assembly factor [Hymenobacter nitidus]